MTQDNEQKKAPEKLAENIRQTLDESANNIDELTLSRIRAARANAVAAAEEKQSAGRGWIPAGSFATALVAVLALSILNQNSGDITPVLESDDMEMLASVESLEMLDDLEFYQWLDLELDEKLEPNAKTDAATLG